MTRTGTEQPRHLPALVVMTLLFFTWGLITSLNDVLIPHLKAVFTLSYTQAMLIQFSFFGAYFLASLPSGRLVERVGYRSGIIIGLVTAAVGCIGFLPAASQRSYGLFLTALFVLACGITLLQVAANPLVAALGPARTAASRLNLTQAFNSLGTTLGPIVGSMLILAGTPPSATGGHHAISAVQLPYLLLGVGLLVTALLFARFRIPASTSANAGCAQAPETEGGWRIRQHPRLALGAVGIFMYVGAEVTIGSLLVNFMTQPDIGGLSEAAAGRYLSLYWGGAMVGRFIGAAVLRVVRPGNLLAFNAVCAVLLLVASMLIRGPTAMYTVLAIGLFNSIMFPTLFTLAIADPGAHSGKSAGVLCTAIVGGAIVPVLTGMVADQLGIARSFLVPALCYVYIAFYGWK
jgi:FHS family L-fucose permease-like MFS transporter